MLYYKRNINDLIHDVKYFWSYKKFGPKVYKNINNIHKIVQKCQKLILPLPIIVLLSFCLRPVFKINNNFIYYSFIPWNSKILDILILLSQYYITILIIPIICGSDFLYVSYSVHVASQIYLLNRELKNLQVKNCNADIYEYIKHHQLMLS